MDVQLYLCIIICSFVVTAKSDVYCISSVHENLNLTSCRNFSSLFNIQVQSNTNIYFMNGTHNLDRLFQFNNVTNITLVGIGGINIKSGSNAGEIYYEPFSRIVCTDPSSGISFVNVTNVIIANITFANCGNQNPNGKSAAIYFFSTDDVMIEGISIQNATGYGIQQQGPPIPEQNIYIIDQSYMYITRSSFITIDGTAVDSSNSFRQLIISDSMFINSTYGITIENGSLLTVNNCTFVNTSTGLATSNDILRYQMIVDITQCSFISSGIGYSGVGVNAIILDNCTFSNTTAAMIASIAFYVSIEQTHFENVKLPTHFVSIYKVIITNSNFNNYINAGMYIYTTYIIIQDSIFSNSKSSSIYALQSNVFLTQNVSFSNGYSIGYGGALYLSSSTVIFYAPVRVSFINNTAQLGGGAIYSDYQNSNLYCFYELVDTMGTLNSPEIQLYFERNVAGEAGKDLYASLNCTPNNYIPNYDIQQETNLDIMKNLSVVSAAPLNIAADPLIVCLSSEMSTQCSNNQTEPFIVLLHPGQTKTLSISTIDEYRGMTPSLVFFLNPDGSIYDTIRTKVSGVDYVIKNALNITLSLVPQVIFISGLLSNYKTLQVTILDTECPHGFILNAESGVCECITLFKQQNVMCNISDEKIIKPLYSWIGNKSDGAFLFYETCSLEYCNANTTVDLQNHDDQCNNNHSGVLCGGCRPGYSEVFGRPLCRKCSNMYLLLLIPFAIMGVVLVALLIILNLTVSNGTLNGFIFYANIIKINDDIFRPTYSANTVATVLSTFISWLNLDLGIVTCFYDGMNVRGEIWLQFAFPAYIFMLVGAIIIASRYSARISRLCRHNVVPVMATLILISYSKLLKTSINIFSRAVVHVEYNNVSSYDLVWKYNGNIGYFSEGHVGLFIAAILLVVLFIVPYMLLLLLSPCTKAKSHWRIFCWVNKLKPFIDSYEGPYISRHRFWTGVLLLIRIPIFVTTAGVDVTSSNTNLVLTIFFAIGLVIYLSRFTVYKKWLYCMLEMFLYINLSVLFQLTLFFRTYDNDAISSSTSSALVASYSIMVGSALVLFITMVTINVYSKCCQLCPSKVIHSKELDMISKEPQISSSYAMYDEMDLKFQRTDGKSDESNDYREELLSDI